MFTAPGRRRWRCALALIAGLLLAGCSGDVGAQKPFSTPASYVGPHLIHESRPLGAKWTWSDVDAIRPYLSQLGGGATFYEVVLCNVEAEPGQFDWHQVDSVIRQAAALHDTTLVKIRVGRCWVTGGHALHQRGTAGITESAMPSKLSDYTQFVQDVVRRYAPFGITEYALENEVNSPSFWAGTPAQYAILARAGAAAVHKADPQALVADPGISSVAAGYSVVQDLLTHGQSAQAVQVYNAYYARRFGTRSGAQSIDAVDDADSLTKVLGSPYVKLSIDYMSTVNQLLAEHVFQVRQVHYYEQADALPALLTYERAHTPHGVPIELWELGLYDEKGAISETDVAVEVVKDTAEALASGVRRVLWLPLASNPDGRVGSTLHGLTGSAGQATPASTAYLAIQRAARSARVSTFNTGVVTGVVLKHGHQVRLFVWATTSLARFVAPFAIDQTVLTSSDGTPQRLAAGEQVDIGASPVELHLHGTLAGLEEALR